MPEKKSSIFYLFMLWLGCLINNYIWLRSDINCLTYDSHRHFLVSLKIFDAYRHFSSKIFENFMAATQLHPPLVGIITAPFYFIFGISQDTGVMISAAVFSAILIFYTYRLGEKIINEKAGLLAAFLIIAYPVVFNQLNVYMLDLPLTAFVAMSIYFLLKTDFFRNLKYSVFFGISLGLGMLIKQTFILFIVGPLVYMIVNVFLFNNGGANRFKKNILYLMLSLTLGFLVALPYYSHIERSVPLLEKITEWKWVITWPTPVPESNIFLDFTRSLLWYIWGLINWQVSFFYFLIFLLGLFLYSRSLFENKGILYLWILVSWVLVSYFKYAIEFNMEVTGVRYTMPFLPSVALISAAGIMQIDIRKIRLFFVNIILAFGLFQLFLTSYDIPGNWLHKKIVLNINVSERIKKYRMFPDSVIILNFKPWNISGRDANSYPINARGYMTANEKIFKVINSSVGDKQNNTVFIIPDDTHLWYLQYKAYMEKASFKIICDWNYLDLYMWMDGKDHDEETLNLINGADYIIEKDGGWIGEYNVQDMVRKAQYYFGLNKGKFLLLEKIAWPDNSNIFIYKRKR